jgi:hypothetical protein
MVTVTQNITTLIHLSKQGLMVTVTQNVTKLILLSKKY